MVPAAAAASTGLFLSPNLWIQCGAGGRILAAWALLYFVNAYLKARRLLSAITFRVTVARPNTEILLCQCSQSQNSFCQRLYTGTYLGTACQRYYTGTYCVLQCNGNPDPTTTTTTQTTQTKKRINQIMSHHSSDTYRYCSSRSLSIH
jgi:hypothetical protein